MARSHDGISPLVWFSSRAVFLDALFRHGNCRLSFVEAAFAKAFLAHLYSAHPAYCGYFRPGMGLAGWINFGPPAAKPHYSPSGIALRVRLATIPVAGRIVGHVFDHH